MSNFSLGGSAMRSFYCVIAGTIGIFASCAGTLEGVTPRDAGPGDSGMGGGGGGVGGGGGGISATGAPTSPGDFPADTYVPKACTGTGGASPHTLCVDGLNGLNTSGTEDGTNLRPFSTIAAAVAVLQTGDVIQVARGRYNEAVEIVGRSFSLVGGFRGAASAADYAGGTGGDFATRDWLTNTTTIDATGLGDTSALHVSDCGSGAFIDGLTITGGRGLRGGSRNVGGGLRIENCDSTVQYNHITGNDVTIDSATSSDNERGAGLFSDTGTMTARWNLIDHNRSGMGAAIYIGGESGNVHHVVIEENILSENTATDLHSGTAVFTNIVDTTIRHNYIARNNAVIGNSTIYISGNPNFDPSTFPYLKLSHNSIEGNTVGRGGSGIFVDNHSSASLEGDVFNANGCGSEAGSVLVAGDVGPDQRSYVSLTDVTISNAQCAPGSWYPGGSALTVDDLSWVTIYGVLTLINNPSPDIYIQDGSQIINNSNIVRK